MDEVVARAQVLHQQEESISRVDPAMVRVYQVQDAESPEHDRQLFIVTMGETFAPRCSCDSGRVCEHILAIYLREGVIQLPQE